MITVPHCGELYPPHFSCWGGDPLLVWLHTLADGVVALSYFAIPAALFYLARKYRVKRLSTVFTLYGAFVLLCGTTHVFDVVTVWRGGYWLYFADGIVRAATGAVSVAAAVVTVRCARDALVGFTRLAVYERKMGERLEYLRAQGETHSEWVTTLKQLRRLAQQATAYADLGTDEKGG